MAKSYTSGELVPRGRVGTGAAQVLTRPQSDPLGRFYRAKNAGIDPKAAAAQKASEYKSFDTLMKYSAPKGWDVLSKELYDNVKNWREAEVKAGDFTSMEGKVRRKNAQDGFEMMAAYQQDIKGKYDASRSQVEAIQQKHGIYNMPKYLNQVYDTFFEQDESGVTRVKPTFSWQAEDLEKAATNPDNFNHLKVWELAIKAFPEQTDKFIEKHGERFMLEQQKHEFRGRNMLKENGMLQLNENGMPVIDMDINDPNDEAKQVLMQNDWVKAIVDKGRANGVSEAEIWKTPMKLFQKSLSRDIGATTRSFTPQHYIDRNTGADFNVQTADYVTRQHNVPGRGGVVDVSILREYTIGGTKMDKPIQVQSKEAWNIDPIKREEGWVGNRAMTITSLQYVPWNNDPRVKRASSATVLGLTIEGKSKGHPVYLSQEDFNKKQLTDKYYGGRWMAQGTYTDEDAIVHQYLIPYDQVRGKIREITKTSKYGGFDLYDIPMYQRGEAEVIDYVKDVFKKAVPPLTPDQIIEKAQAMIENKIE